MKLHTIVHSPLIKEKTIRLAKQNVYALRVHIKAMKKQIVHAIEHLYNVEVKNVNTVIRKGKVVKVGRKRSEKKKPDIKIAYITLKKGSLDVIPKE